MSHESPQLVKAHRGYSISYKGKTLLSTIDPIRQVERVIQSVPITHETLYIILSPLFGYGLSALCSRLPEDSAIICVECDPELYSITQSSFFSNNKLNKEISYLVTDSPVELCQFVRNLWKSRSFRKVEAVPLTAGWKLYTAVYTQLIDAIQKDILINW